MKPSYRTAALCAAAAASVAVSCGARAQIEPHRPPPEFQAMREAHERQRAQDLRTILRLRPDQEPVLTAFLQSHRRSPPPERRGPPAAAPPRGPMTTPQRLDEMARREAEHAQARQRRADAIRAFYAALSPEQRPVFDALMRMHEGPHGPGGRGGHGFGGPDGPHGGLPGGPPPG
jgi:Spy/CpxP family protein refolding chaperone